MASKKKTTKKARAIPMLKESAHEIWLAGLGAFAMAGEEGGRLFKQLVKRGEGVEKGNKNRIERLTARAEDLKGDARTAVSRVTTPIESGMTNAMHRLGVPTRKEIANLTKRVEELTKAVARSKGKGGARRSRRAAESTPTA